jgi:hypothetical protein
MCWYHMFSETSVGIFVFRSRETPSCSSAWVKMEFHVQREELETAILTVSSCVFDGCATKFMYVTSRMRAKASFLDDNQEQQAKCECFSVLITMRAEKSWSS